MCTIHNRRSKRLPYRKKVRFGHKAPKHTGHTLNFSYHGIVIESTTIYAPGSSIVLEIDDTVSENSSASVVAIGKVVWANRGISLSPRGKMGIEFSKTTRGLKEIYKLRSES